MATARKIRPAAAPPITEPDEQADAFEQSEGFDPPGGPAAEELDAIEQEEAQPGQVLDDAPAGPAPAAMAEMRQLMGLQAEPDKEFSGELRIRQPHQLPVRSRPSAEVVHATQIFPERFPRKTDRGWESPEGDPCPEPFRVGGQFGARLIIVQKAGGRRRMVAARLHDPQDKWGVNLRTEKVVREYELIFDVESWRDDWLHEFSGGKLGAKDPLARNDLDPHLSPGLSAPAGTSLQI